MPTTSPYHAAYGHRLLAVEITDQTPLPATGVGGGQRLRIATTFGAFEFAPAGPQRPSAEQLKAIAEVLDGMARAKPMV